MNNSGDFLNKHIQVVTKAENELEGTLINLEPRGLFLKGVDADSSGDKDTYIFIPSESIDHVWFHPDGEY